MSVKNELESLRAAFPGCSMVAFADIDARLVLVSSSAGTARRDTLDKLCGTAISLFDKAEADADTALHLRSTGTVHIFLRDPDQRSDTLCTICTPETQIDRYLTAARAVLGRISSSDGAA